MAIWLNNDIVLDALSRTSIEDYMEVYQHPSMLFSISKSQVPIDAAHAVQEISKLQSMDHQGIGLYFGIFHDNKFIGSCGLHSYREKERCIEVSYEVHPAYWGQGIATKALKKCIGIARERFNVRFVFAYTLLENVASHRVAEKAGMQAYSTVKHDIYFNDRWVDRKIYMWDYESENAS